MEYGFTKTKSMVVILLFMIFFWIALNYNVSKQFKIVSKVNIETTHFRNKENLKYILIWTDRSTDPFYHFELGRNSFTRPGCKFNNCFITDDRNLMNIIDWDAILFHAPEYTWKRKNLHGFPEDRSSNQIYIFGCIESSANYPICNSKWNSYFNWTMTYRIDSDVPWMYLTVKDTNGTVVAPRQNVHWISDMQNISMELNDQLKNKTKAVAWFVSNCETKSHREMYVKKLKWFLEKSGLVLDIYGKCGEKKCPVDNKEVCWEYLRNDYYFYLSFENSFSEDYTTEKLLQAMQNNVVPIVFGGSNYSRFAPPGSYINARDYKPLKLAAFIKKLILNHDEYVEYFKWKKYYTYHSVYDSHENHPFCNLCDSLNDPQKVNGERNKYKNLEKWWNNEPNIEWSC